MDVAVPSMILQPLVENAIRHGLEPCTKGGTLTISARLHGGGCSCRSLTTARVAQKVSSHWTRQRSCRGEQRAGGGQACRRFRPQGHPGAARAGPRPASPHVRANHSSRHASHPDLAHARPSPVPRHDPAHLHPSPRALVAEDEPCCGWRCAPTCSGPGLTCRSCTKPRTAKMP